MSATVFSKIYEWRGAVNAMEKVASDHAGYMTTSFRFGREIAEAASGVLRTLGEKRPLMGNSSIQSRIGPNVPTPFWGDPIRLSWALFWRPWRPIGDRMSLAGLRT